MIINFIFHTQNTIFPKKILKKKIEIIINHLFKKNIKKRLNLNFVFVDNRTIKKFKKKFFGQNEPTDVICFKYDKYSADIMISLMQVKKNSKIYKTSYKKELMFVIIHGLLHFKGMRDNTEEQREKMFDVGNKLIKKVLK